VLRASLRRLRAHGARATSTSLDLGSQISQEQVKATFTARFIRAGRLQRVANRREPTLKPRPHGSINGHRFEHALRRREALRKAVLAA